MKKLFISCPMKGRTEEQIRANMKQLHEIAEAVFQEKLEAIDSYIEHKPPKDARQAVWYLGESIKKMAEADYYIGVYGGCYQGCLVENDVADYYGISRYFVDIDYIDGEEQEVSKLDWSRVAAELQEDNEALEESLYEMENER